MSRMNEKKGVSQIVESAKRLNSNGYGDKYIVDFYGTFEDETYKTTILERIKCMDNVNYQGVLNMGENSGFDKLAEYTAMLFPTFWPGEGFPGVLIDALMAGLPVIASDWHFNPDIVEEGKTGVLIKTQDANSLYTAMKDVIEHRDKYVKMADYCQKTAAKYDVKNVINKEFLNKVNM